MSSVTCFNNPGSSVRIFALMPGHLLSLELQASQRSRHLPLILMFPGEIKDCLTGPAVGLWCPRGDVLLIVEGRTLARTKNWSEGSF